MRELKYGLVAIVTIIIILVGGAQYIAYENRKAYYACLELSERLAEQQNKPMAAYALYRCHIAELKELDEYTINTSTSNYTSYIQQTH